MVSLDTTTHSEDGVTLVTLALADATVPTRVRVENRLDGPVWPPRSHGVPEEGWDETGVTTVLRPGRRRTLGYATPAPPTDPPAEIQAAEPLDDDGDGPAPADVIRSLGDPAPPRDVVAPSPTTPGGTVEGDLPPVLAAWLDAVEARIDAASERDRTDGPDAAADERRLRTLSRRSRALAERARTVRDSRP